MKKYYDLLGLDENASLEDVNNAFNRLAANLYNERLAGTIGAVEYSRKYDELDKARKTIIANIEEDIKAAAMAREIGESVRKQTGEDKEEKPKVEQPEGKQPEKPNEVDPEEPEEKDKKTGAKKSHTGWKVAACVVGIALLACSIKGCHDYNERNGIDKFNTGAYVTQQMDDRNKADTSAETETEAKETESPSVVSTPEAEPEIDYGDIMDESLVSERAQVLADQLENAGIVDVNTGTPYTAERIQQLIRYASGVYVPESMEEIDLLHLDLLNMFISPINTDDYLYHVVFASGNDDFNNLLNPNPKHVGFAESFAKYGNNGVYPLVEWFQNKRFEIYSSTDRNEVNSIYREVGQAMADIMKGNGCTILVDGKECTFTSEQLLANPASAMIVSTEFQLVMANHYEIRNELGEIVDQVNTTWDVYNKFNSNGVDENGNPIIEPDKVTYDEMNAWVNNGCDYEWGIDDVLINGQTFGQRIQGDMEGMAQNNFHMQNHTLKK